MSMSSRGKKKTTMAKLTREARLRERRMEKQERKDARRDAAAMRPDDYDPLAPRFEDDDVAVDQEPSVVSHEA
jgi:hypothetical protein